MDKLPIFYRHKGCDGFAFVYEDGAMRELDGKVGTMVFSGGGGFVAGSPWTFRCCSCGKMIGFEQTEKQEFPPLKVQALLARHGYEPRD
jgi:hypothetical protein